MIRLEEGGRGGPLCVSKEEEEQKQKATRDALLKLSDPRRQAMTMDKE
jgi:hypothetical protein